jgi:hypothetical protein
VVEVKSEDSGSTDRTERFPAEVEIRIAWPERRLTPRQQQSIALLAGGKRPAAVEAEMGLVGGTLRRWFRVLRYRRALLAAKQRKIAEVDARIEALFPPGQEANSKEGRALRALARQAHDEIAKALRELEI